MDNLSNENKQTHVFRIQNTDDLKEYVYFLGKFKSVFKGSLFADNPELIYLSWLDHNYYCQITKNQSGYDYTVNDYLNMIKYQLITSIFTWETYHNYLVKRYENHT